MTKKTKRDKLIKLREDALNKKDLPLKEGATKLVFGEGNPESEILFIGEGPGHWEDVKGRPFVGNAGAFLNQLLQSIKLDRKDVFITNMIMYRPPENRDPTDEELKAFKPYIDGIVDIIDPKIIVTLGRFSMGKFIPGVYISNVHGKKREIEWDGKKKLVVPMYHPAAGLRRNDIREALKNDFAKLPEILNEMKEEEKNDDKIQNQGEQKNLF